MVTKYREILSCEVCGNNKLNSVLNLGMHPMCDDLVPINDSRVCDEFPIEILFCSNCNTAHQRFQVSKTELFPLNYHYRSRFTSDVLKGMEDLLNSCIIRFGNLKDKKVLDIGCNDGSLLDFFRDMGAFTVGIEPTLACSEASLKGHITYNDYLSEELTSSINAIHGKFDFIIFTNVFAHIEILEQVLHSIKILMSKNTIIVIENHYLGSVLEGRQFDTFYHEHPRTYSYTSFEKIAFSLDTELSDVEFPSRYGGNIRVFLGASDLFQHKNCINLEHLKSRENNFLNDFHSLNNDIKKWIEKKNNFIRSQVSIKGKLKAKAFPGRAAILVKLLKLDIDLISAVYEKPGSLKIGNYLPGTRIPILSDKDLFDSTDQSELLLNLAWHIPQEIKNYLHINNYRGSVVDIISSSDFT